MDFRDAKIIRKNFALINSGHFLSNSEHVYLSECFDCENWNCSQVTNWLLGIDPKLESFQENITKLKINGLKLLNFNDDLLKEIGIYKESLRAKVMRSINLLIYYSHTIKNENLQKLAINVKINVNSLLNSVAVVTSVINYPIQSTQIFEVLKKVLRAIFFLYESIQNLILWLNRSPFDNKKEFIFLREKITVLIKEIVECVNNPDYPKLIPVSQILIENGKKIQEYCHQIIYMDDPIVLYTSYLKRVVIRKTSQCRWGFDIGCVYNGINMITRVNLESPAGLSGKINAGDEILMINNVPVVGWNHKKLLQIINSQLNNQVKQPQCFELILLLNKRPQENYNNLTQSSVNITPPKSSKMLFLTNHSKMMLDFKLKIQPDLFSKNQKNNLPNLIKGRSLSFNLSSMSCIESNDVYTEPAIRCVSLFISSNKKQIFQKNSISSKNLSNFLRMPFNSLNYLTESNSWLLLLLSWGNNRQKLSELFQLSLESRTTEINNNILKEEDFEENLFVEKKKLQNLSDIEFCIVDYLSEKEIEEHKLFYSSSIHDSDWNAPINEITGLKIKNRVHLESGLNVSLIDSPLSTIYAKITKFFYGEPVTSLHSSSTISAFPVLTETLKNVSSSKLMSDKNKTFLKSQPNIKMLDNDKQNKANFKTPKITFNRASEHDINYQKQTFLNYKNNSLLSLTKDNQTLNNVESSNVLSKSKNSINLPVFTQSLLPSVKNLMSNDKKNIKQTPFAQSNKTKNLSFDSIKNFDISDYKIKKSKLHELASIPCQSHKNKTIEGLVRRQKLLHLDKGLFEGKIKQKSSQWIKCWMVLVNNLLFLYDNKFAEEAIMIINISYFSLNTAIKLKTTKKHVLSLRWNKEILNFAFFSDKNLKQWVKFLLPITNKVFISPTTTSFENTNNNNNEKNNALFMRSTFYLNNCNSSCGESNNGTDGVPSSPFSIKTSTSAITTSLPSLYSNNFTFLPAKILLKVRRKSSLQLNSNNKNQKNFRKKLSIEQNDEKFLNNLITTSVSLNNIKSSKKKLLKKII